MRRYLVIHLSLLVSYFILVSLINGWISLLYLPFWIGGIVGFVLPDLDYAIYHYFLRTSTTPTVNAVVNDVTSQNVVQNWVTAAEERDSKKLIFHTAQFQVIFWMFVIFVMTSSNSLLGKGIVLSFMLHLVVDMLIDWKYKGNIDAWFQKFPLVLDQRQKVWYMAINGVLLVLMGLLL